MPEEFEFKRELERLPGNGFMPAKLKGVYQEWKTQADRLCNRLRPKEVDLRKTLVSGEAGFDAETWAEMTGDMSRASMLLVDSPHVRFLEQYRAMGKSVFLRKNFERTSYFKNAVDCVRCVGDYFSQKTIEGLLVQAQSFVTLYERIKKGDSLEVNYPSSLGRSEPGSLPTVRETWTPNIFQIDDGLHRLAANWVLGRKKAKVIVLSPPIPTALQHLVGKVSQEWGERELYELQQPIDEIEFDDSWPIVRRCCDRLAMMLTFLDTYFQPSRVWSVLDLACSYGWFVSQFAKRGCHSVGVDPNSAALKIGQIAYGLKSGQLVQSDLKKYLVISDRTFDVVLFMGMLHRFVPKSDFGNPEEILKQVDKITGSIMFFETGQAHESWFRTLLPEWNDDFIIRFILRHTSFNRVIPLGTDSDNVGGFGKNFGRTLFACVRS